MEFHPIEIIRLCPYSAIVAVPPTVPHVAAFAKIVFVDKGSCVLDFNDKRGDKLVSHNLKEGDAFIVPSYQPCTYHVSPSVSYSHRDIYLSEEMLKEACDYVKDGLYDELKNGLPNIMHLSTPSLIYFAERCSLLLGKDMTPEKDAIRKAVVLDFVSRCVANATIQLARPVWINELLRRIDDEEFLSLSIEDMVVTTNYSHGYVNRKFKKYMGCSLKHFVNARKLELSSIMLATSDVTLQEIVIRLGFTTTSSFITLFKEKYGITPWQYRKTQSAYISKDSYSKWGRPKEL